MRNLDASPYLTHSDLKKTEAKGNDKRNRFEFGLDVRVRKTENPDDAQGGDKTAPGEKAVPGAKPAPEKALPGAATPASAVGGMP